MKKLILTLMFILLLIFPSNAIKEEPIHDSYWWEGMSVMPKLNFVSGYLHGMQIIFKRLTYYQMPDSLYAKHQDRSDKYWTVNWAYSVIYWDHELYGLTYGQLIEGLDEFYKDYRNKQVLFDDAIQIVKLELRGEKKEIIEEQKRWQRIKTTRNVISDDEFLKKLFKHYDILDSLKKK